MHRRLRDNKESLHTAAPVCSVGETYKTAPERVLKCNDFIISFSIAWFVEIAEVLYTGEKSEQSTLSLLSKWKVYRHFKSLSLSRKV